jgi:hypothetical protein
VAGIVCAQLQTARGGYDVLEGIGGVSHRSSGAREESEREIDCATRVESDER